MNSHATRKTNYFPGNNLKADNLIGKTFRLWAFTCLKLRPSKFHHVTKQNKLLRVDLWLLFTFEAFLKSSLLRTFYLQQVDIVSTFRWTLNKAAYADAMGGAEVRFPSCLRVALPRKIIHSSNDNHSFFFLNGRRGMLSLWQEVICMTSEPMRKRMKTDCSYRFSEFAWRKRFFWEYRIIL